MSIMYPVRGIRVRITDLKCIIGASFTLHQVPDITAIWTLSPPPPTSIPRARLAADFHVH